MTCVSVNAVALFLASVIAVQAQHIDVEELKDPVLREMYLEDLSALHQQANHHHKQHHKKASLAATVPAELLPGNHELVDEALTDLPAQLHELQQKQTAVNEAQGKLRGFVNDASVHLSDAAQIKRSIARKEAQLRYFKEKQHNLQDDSTQIEGAHSALVSSVHEVHDPNVGKAELRLKKKQEILKLEEDATKYLAEQKEEVQMKTTEAIREAEAAKKKLFELKSETTLALQQDDIAERKAVYDKQLATEEDQSLKYAQEQEKAELSRLKAAEKVATEVEKRMQGRTNMRAMEEVEDAQRAMRAEKDEFENWKTNEEHISAQAANMNKQSSRSQTHFLEVEEQVAKAKQEQAEAERQFHRDQALATKEVRTLKYISTKYKGEAAKLKVAEVAAKSADGSVQKLNSIRDTEEQKVHHYLASGKNKIQGKMKRWEAARAQTTSEIDSLQKQYESWQQEQLKRSEEVDQTQQESEKASEEYAAGQREAFTKAQEKVFEDEVDDSRSSWGGEWASEESF